MVIDDHRRQKPPLATKIFAIPELLEAILPKLNDPMIRGEDWTTSVADLFTCLRVNKTFNLAITGSISLKPVMLLEFDHVREPQTDGQLLNELRPRLPVQARFRALGLPERTFETPPSYFCSAAVSKGSSPDKSLSVRRNR
ncbi:hypothetical protein DOTSEDRAFT_25535 [Dothistroma septosporum NZE10]|uniref:Uncharacterized protein n=1 Tax=Dothistroma septosporum (strain NZE10 / CBS 128990) TaxID=675120 RepID=M2XMD0_DOTSN|nr:hypothetical protein DOTSEDRAFT_25535 [Dothistroma septosporum NZE10]